ncbi:MAG TPA: hypothetical protein VG733_03140, partial [Chthoniobacteraceae bacterium]|nr:hypothetical protein [Chthoniobacteraceae bacterium]
MLNNVSRGIAVVVVVLGFHTATFAAGDDIPVPPMQGKPWTPPETKLPPVVVSAITELFDEGMADPRGCEYREVEIPNSESYEPNQKIHAWVLPGDGKTRYAVGWNGRVIPVVKVGPAADLKKDLAPDARGQGQLSQIAWGIFDWNSLSEKSTLPIKAALLMRLGEAELAENVMKSVPGNPDNDPYLTMAREWILCWFHRGVTAHTKGDDKLALQIFHKIATLQETAIATAKRRGISNGAADFSELRDLALLTADQERRAREPPHVAAVNAGIVDQHERIAAFIRDLELADGESLFSEFGTDMSGDASVHALIREGDAAIEPLLDCLENDNRLTRAQFYAGSGGMTRMLPDHPEPPGPWVRVYEPAYIALTGILRITPMIDPVQGGNPHDMSAGDRKALAAKFRKYLAAHQGQTAAERLFARLRDDKADVDEWFLMGDEISQHINEESIPRGMFGGGGGSSYGVNGDPVPLRCESLRAKSNPSVSDVFIKRFLQMLSYYHDGGSIDPDRLGNFLRESAEWIGPEHLDDLRDLMKRYNSEIGY